MTKPKRQPRGHGLPQASTKANATLLDKPMVIATNRRTLERLIIKTDTKLHKPGTDVRFFTNQRKTLIGLLDKRIKQDQEVSQ